MIPDKKNPIGKISELNGSYASDANARAQTLTCFILAVLGFSFWFFMVVPFASHRESYSWLAAVQTHSFAHAFSFPLSTTYRPLGDPMTWSGFVFLNPSVFPTSAVRQALLQGLVYGMFLLAWWLIVGAAPQRRLFALIACIVGGVFFSGYLHLFHIYGLMYVPAMITTAALLRFRASGTLDKREVLVAAVAILLASWHPFATALFLGFYFGFYLDTFWQRNKARHVRACGILVITSIAIAAVRFTIPPFKTLPLKTKLFGFLVSYQTNEVNGFASLVAAVLTLLVVLNMELSLRVKLAVLLVISALSVVFHLIGLPILLLWLSTVLIKLIRMRSWSLFFLALTATVLPFGGGIGTPIYALFAIVVAAYVTPLGWSPAEKALCFIKPRYVLGAAIVSTIVVGMVRVGIEVPLVTRVGRPLLAERERTYQLENILAWLHGSRYCGYEISFAQNAGSPIDDVENALTRRNRPPAALEDVQLFWRSVLQCQNSGQLEPGTVVVTFGGPGPRASTPVFELKGKYASEAMVWVSDSYK